MPDKGVQVKNRRTFKLFSAKILPFKMDLIPMGCPPPRSSFLGLSAFCPTVPTNLCAYLLLYWVPLPQISAMRRPIVTKLCGHNKDLIVCQKPQNDRNREIFRGTSGPVYENRFSKMVYFHEFLYFFPSN